MAHAVISSAAPHNAFLFRSRPPISHPRHHTMPPTPSPSRPQESHLPPSLPSSPLPKRFKIMAQSTSSSSCAEQTSNSPVPPAFSPSPPLLIQKLSSAATAPTRGSKFAAGYDLYCARPTTIPARGKGLVDTDLAIAVPEGTCRFSFYF